MPESVQAQSDELGDMAADMRALLAGIMLLGFSFSVLIGIAFGLIPARRAAALDPIDALRAE